MMMVIQEKIRFCAMIVLYFLAIETCLTTILAVALLAFLGETVIAIITIGGSLILAFILSFVAYKIRPNANTLAHYGF